MTELVGPAEIAERLGVQRQTVATWRRREVGFPAPAAIISGRAVYDWAKVAAWDAERPTKAHRRPEGRAN